MKALTFTLELLSDISITRDAATEGAHVGLDYLPGSLFLGWVAGQKYAQWKSQSASAASHAWIAFHSGSVRFRAATLQGALPTALSWHRRKGAEFISADHIAVAQLADLSREDWDTWEQRSHVADASRQPQQVRSGWFDPHTGAWLEPDEHMRMKTAIDRDGFGRAKNRALFGYSALSQGQSFTGCIEIDEGVPDDIVDELVALFAKDRELRLGRSRSAEFGAARITGSHIEPQVGDTTPREVGDTIVVYAASDLCLLDRYGQPTTSLEHALHGTALAGASIVPERTHVRTRRYAAWNAFHQSPGPSRLLVTQGSVFVLKLASTATLPEQLWLGLHQSEGLGRVLLNPTFLSEAWAPQPAKHTEDNATPAAVAMPDLPFVSLLRTRQRATKLDALARAQGLLWASDWKQWKTSPSQWSRVREVASRHRHASRDALVRDLRDVFTHGLTSEKAWRGKGNEERWPANKLLAALGAPPIKGGHDYRERPDPAPIAFTEPPEIQAKLTDSGLDPRTDLDAFLIHALHHAAANINRARNQES